MQIYPVSLYSRFTIIYVRVYTYTADYDAHCSTHRIIMCVILINRVKLCATYKAEINAEITFKVFGYDY